MDITTVKFKMIPEMNTKKFSKQRPILRAFEKGFSDLKIR